MQSNDRELFENELLTLANKYSATRIKVSTINFDLDYKRNSEGALVLVSEKAIIRVLGKVTKVAIGAGTEFSTYEEAFEATKKHWQEYYRDIRANRTPAQKAAEHRRQKRYREKLKNERIGFEERN